MLELRWNPILKQWVIIATHRQNRTYKPPKDYCPLCPTKKGGLPTEVPAEDYDITNADKKMVEKYKLDQIRFGDIVAISDADKSFGRSYREGAGTIGIVVHSDCVIAGHGPGVATLLTSPKGNIKFHLDPEANIANYLNIGSKRK